MLIHYEQVIRINSFVFVQFNIKRMFAFLVDLWYTKLEVFYG